MKFVKSSLIFKCSLDELRILFSLNIDIDKRERSFFGNTLLIAVIQKYGVFRRENFEDVLNMIKFLIKRGVNINSPNNQLETPLFLACRYRLRNIASYLLDANADMEIENEDGRTALSISLIYKNLEISKMLIERGANLDHQDKYGNTSLMLDLRNSGEMIEILLKKGANKTLRNEEGKTALDIAKEKNFKILNIL